jgi:hypothetical protein
MRKKHPIPIPARASQRTAEDADRLGRAVEDILRNLKKGKEVELPGLGRLIPGPGPSIRFERTSKEGARGRD